MSLHKNYAPNGDASHYDENRLNTIVKFERTYGTEAVMTFCEITADKYRERLGKKDSVEQDLIKLNWYENAARFYYKRLGTADEIVRNNRIKGILPWNEAELKRPEPSKLVNGEWVPGDN